MAGHRLLYLVVSLLTADIVRTGRVPAIPSGRRTQYLYLLDSGGYKYGYDTGASSFEKAIANDANEVVGSYSYDSPAGPVSVEYTSGVGGYRPTKLSVPKGNLYRKTPPSFRYGDPYAHALHHDSSHTDGTGYHGAYYVPSLVTSYKSPVPNRTGYIAAIGHIPSSLALSDGIITEASPYLTRFATITAVPTTVNAKTPTSNPDGLYSFSYNAGDHSRQKTVGSQGNVFGSYSFLPKGDATLRKINYETGAEKGFLATGSDFSSTDSPPFFPASTLSQTYSLVPSTQPNFSQDPVSGDDGSDKSYSFSYTAPDHSRQETSDSRGNVVGSFSFIPKSDGVLRKVDYLAGSATGFVAEGSHLPSKNTGNVKVAEYSRTVSPTPLPNTYSTTNLRSHITSRVASPDGSYSFSYNVGDHTRQESSDSKGNVAGSFSFVPKDDGIPRKVDYEAGAEKGFIAKGTHLPKQPSEVITSDSYNSNYNMESKIGRGHTAYSQGGRSKSYEFSYHAGDHTRYETSDEQGNVKGGFSFISKGDGTQKSVTYEADAGQGFVARGSHLPKQSIASLNPTTFPNIQTYAQTQYPVTSTNSLEESASVDDNKDASYSFSYNAGDHSRQESSDAQGNVAGSFAFTSSDDGISRRVDYQAGAERGFTAQGAHLPKEAPSFSLTDSVKTFIPYVGNQGFLAVQPHTYHSTSAQIVPFASSNNNPLSHPVDSIQEYRLGTAAVKTFLTSKQHKKVGYVYDSLH